ncbi:hypothetical protein ACUOFC_57555, partial [Escherichia sp. TWPC-MK]
SRNSVLISSKASAKPLLLEAITGYTSNKVIKDMPLYQIAVITNGTEKDYAPLKAVFNETGVSYSQFDGMAYPL